MAIGAGALATIAKRVRVSLTTQPGAGVLVALALPAPAFAALAALITVNTGLVRWEPLPAPQFGLLAMRALVIPAFGEELFFRAALVPARTETARPALWIGPSVALFTAWHVLETTFLPGSAATFLRADFLALAAALGLLCALLGWRSGSIWTAVALHWLAVVAWQGWFGGPAFGAPS